MDNGVNVYPCGLVISPYAPWLAASPDRKVFCPARPSAFGLLEIKCPQAQSVSDVACLDRTDNKLKRSHDYYYQVMCQMAVTGLEWCDFFVMLENGDYHLETINFDQDFWESAQCKLDHFFHNFFSAHSA